jgi:nucleoside 2-deoxyribosyltransferase
MSKLVIYLAGAIRDGVEADITWREKFIDELEDAPVMILNPLSGKLYSPSAKSWTQWSHIPTAKMIVNHDYFCVDKADLIVLNCEALGEGYPMIGSMCELGYAKAKGKLVWSIVPDTVNCGNTMFKLHPFIQENSSMIFDTYQHCLTFLYNMSFTFTGKLPSYCKGELA